MKPMPTPLAVDLELAKAQVEAKIAAEGAASPAAGVFVSYPGSPFELFQPYQPAGDQPTAINERWTASTTVKSFKPCWG
jgi:hypothetical protein